MSLNRRLATLIIAAGAALSSGIAQAHPDVRWAVNVNAPPVAVQVASDRGYGYGVPVYRPAVDAHRRTEYREPTRWDRDADGIPDRYERHHHRHHHHHHRHHERCDARDSDRDGVPNRYDRRPDNPYRW